jgi:hypothetical protein
MRVRKAIEEELKTSHPTEMTRGVTKTVISRCRTAIRLGREFFGVAYNDYDRYVWAVDEPGRLHHGLPTPKFGCSCGQRLDQFTLCRSHRLVYANTPFDVSLTSGND